MIARRLVVLLLLMGAAAMATLFYTRGSLTALVTMYSINVFVTFSLSQTGMVVKWRREREAGWALHAVWNGLGAVLTGLVLVVVAVTKFTEGAWIVVAIIPLLVLHFRSIRRHYRAVARQLSLEGFGGSHGSSRWIRTCTFRRLGWWACSRYATARPRLTSTTS